MDPVGLPSLQCICIRPAVQQKHRKIVCVLIPPCVTYGLFSDRTTAATDRPPKSYDFKKTSYRRIRLTALIKSTLATRCQSYALVGGVPCVKSVRRRGCHAEQQRTVSKPSVRVVPLKRPAVISVSRLEAFACSPLLHDFSEFSQGSPKTEP